MPMIICDLHGSQGCPCVSPGVLCSMKYKNPMDIVFLILRFEEIEDFIYVKKEEIGVFPLVGNLSKNKDKYEYIMELKDERSMDMALHMFQPVCGQCFHEFAKGNSEIIYPYYPDK